MWKEVRRAPGAREALVTLETAWPCEINFVEEEKGFWDRTPLRNVLSHKVQGTFCSRGRNFLCGTLEAENSLFYKISNSTERG